MVELGTLDKSRELQVADIGLKHLSVLRKPVESGRNSLICSVMKCQVSKDIVVNEHAPGVSVFGYRCSRTQNRYILKAVL